MYQYRPLQERLEKKVLRVFKRIPELDYRIIRKCYMLDSGRFIPEQKVDVIITSPPYMRQLSYARDNRLRLWFIGINDWKQLDSKISPTSKNILTFADLALNYGIQSCHQKGSACLFWVTITATNIKCISPMLLLILQQRR